MEINRPIFIVGIQRSGTTILSNLFTRHKETAFFENFSSRYYRSSWKFKFIPFLLWLQRLKYGPNFRPVSQEGRVWNRFFNELEYLDESHATEEIKNYYYSIIKTELLAFNAQRFVNKNPIHCLRLRWLNSMFPDAYYILIWRDPRSVVNSIYQKMIRQWKIDGRTMPSHGYMGYVVVKEKFGKELSKLEACVNFYTYLKKMLLKDLPLIKERTIEIQYEKFVQWPREEIQKLFEYTGLDWYDGLKNDIPEKLEKNNNQKWLTLTSDEIKILNKAFS